MNKQPIYEWVEHLLAGQVENFEIPSYGINVISPDLNTPALTEPVRHACEKAAELLEGKAAKTIVINIPVMVTVVTVPGFSEDFEERLHLALLKILRATVAAGGSQEPADNAPHTAPEVQE